mgnify:CR=1 FL=1
MKKKKEKKKKRKDESRKKQAWFVARSGNSDRLAGERGGGSGGGRGRKVERSCSEINYAKYFPSLEYEIAPLEFLVTRGKRIYFATANPGDRVKNTFDGVAPPFETCREIELLTSTL